MNLNKLAALPDSLLTEIPTASPETSQTEPPPGITEVSKQDIFETGKMAENSPVSDNAGSPFSTVPPSSGATGTFKASPASMSAGGVISGTFAVGLMDSIIPAVLILAGNAAGYEVDKRGLSLTEKEKAQISPAMQTYLDSININFNNPLYNLLFVVAAVYGAKIVEQLPNIKRKEKTSKGSKIVTASPVEEAEQKASEAKKKEQERLNEITLIRKMSKEAAIKYIIDKRKISRDKAVIWLQKNL